MRITKELEVRKQEILDTALRLFGEKGYEKASITDIAKAIGVAQGLCYRYFPSKEALFDSAIEQYADILVEPMRGLPTRRGSDPAADHQSDALHDGRKGHEILSRFSQHGK